MSNFATYFKVVRIVPTIVHTHNHGTVDLRSMDLEKAKKLYEDKFPYLELTEAGKKDLYPEPPAPTATELKADIKTATTRAKVLDLMKVGEEFTSVQTAGNKKLSQLDTNE